MTKDTGIPSVEQAFANMKDIGHDYKAEGYARRGAELNAAAQVHLAEKMMAASLGISDSIDKLIDASNRSSDRLTEFSAQTARATRGLQIATWALFVAMILQIGVMWMTAKP